MTKIHDEKKNKKMGEKESKLVTAHNIFHPFLHNPDY